MKPRWFRFLGRGCVVRTPDTSHRTSNQFQPAYPPNAGFHVGAGDFHPIHCPKPPVTQKPRAT